MYGWIEEDNGIVLCVQGRSQRLALLFRFVSFFGVDLWSGDGWGENR